MCGSQDSEPCRATSLSRAHVNGQVCLRQQHPTCHRAQRPQCLRRWPQDTPTTTHRCSSSSRTLPISKHPDATRRGAQAHTHERTRGIAESESNATTKQTTLQRQVGRCLHHITGCSKPSQTICTRSNGFEHKQVWNMSRMHALECWNRCVQCYVVCVASGIPAHTNISTATHAGGVLAPVVCQLTNTQCCCCCVVHPLCVDRRHVRTQPQTNAS